MTKDQKKDGESLAGAFWAGLERSNSRGVQVALLVGLALALVSVLAVNLLGGAEQFRHLIESAGIFGPAVYIGLKASTYVVAPLSGTPVRLAGGALFGFWDGFIYVLIGDLIGACLNFWLARVFGQQIVVKLAGKKALKQIDETTQHVGGWRALLIARLLLSSLYDFVAYAAGLSYLKFRHFFWVTLLAGIPSTLVSAYVGDSLISNPSLFFGLIVVSAVILLFSLWLGKKTAVK